MNFNTSVYTNGSLSVGGIDINDVINTYVLQFALRTGLSYGQLNAFGYDLSLLNDAGFTDAPVLDAGPSIPNLMVH